jgi:hypothetical protein
VFAGARLQNALLTVPERCGAGALAHGSGCHGFKSGVESASRRGTPLPPRSMKTMELHGRQHADL